MNLTPLQERRLEQVKDEIVFLEKQTKRRGIGFAIWFSLVCIILGNLVSCLIGFLIDHKPLTVYIHDYSWMSFFRNWVIWLLATYFFVVRSNHQALKLKRKELEELRKKYGLIREVTP
jgi:hypothetical protein